MVLCLVAAAGEGGAAMMPFAVKEKCVHYVVVGSPLTFCGIDMRGRKFWESNPTAPSLSDWEAQLAQLPLCKRCAKAHIKQLEVAMGLDDKSWEKGTWEGR